LELFLRRLAVVSNWSDFAAQLRSARDVALVPTDAHAYSMSWTDRMGDQVDEVILRQQSA